MVDSSWAATQLWCGHRLDKYGQRDGCDIHHGWGGKQPYAYTLVAVPRAELDAEPAYDGDDAQLELCLRHRLRYLHVLPLLRRFLLVE